MRIVDIIADLSQEVTGCSREVAMKAAYSTCPPDVDPEDDIPEEEVEGIRAELKNIFYAVKRQLVH
jgi:hypothetical protein